MIMSTKDARQFGVPWFYGPVARYPELRATQYWIRPFNILGRWFRHFMYQMDETLNWPEGRDDRQFFGRGWQIFPCPMPKVTNANR